jgi:hypothetical protein
MKNPAGIDNIPGIGLFSMLSYYTLKRNGVSGVSIQSQNITEINKTSVMPHSPMEIYRDTAGMLEKILWRQPQFVHELKELS